jgi:hypothetical protein
MRVGPEKLGMGAFRFKAATPGYENEAILCVRKRVDRTANKCILICLL